MTDDTCPTCEGARGEPGFVAAGVAFRPTVCPTCWGDGFVRRDTTDAAPGRPSPARPTVWAAA